MIFILHRYLFKELLRVFVLSTVALTLIVSVGLLVPIIRDYGVGPGQILSLIGHFLPITLTFVMPISALFSAAITYGRFAADRELDACRASGVRFRTLIYPGLCLAFFVAIVNLLLNFYITPEFVQRTEQSVKSDAKQILFRNIQRRGYYQIPRGAYKIYAENVRPEQSLLQDVVILDVDNETGGLTRMITARDARVEIENLDEHTMVSIRAEEVTRMDDRSASYVGRLEITQRIRSLLEDSIKFKKIEQLKRIRTDKMNFGPIYDDALEARAQLALERLAVELMRTMKEGRDYYRLDGAESFSEYRLSVSNCKVESGRLRLIGPIRLLEIDRDRNRIYCRYDCDAGFISLKGDSFREGLELSLETPQWERSPEVKGTALQKVTPNIPLPASVAEELEPGRLLATLRQVGQAETIGKQKVSAALLSRVATIEKNLRKVDSQILAELHSRLVLGMGCVSLIITGICLGIRFRGGHILSAFGASAIPAGLLIVFIMAGKQLTKNAAASPSAGVALMWAGFVVLLLLAVKLYRGQAKI